jgi:hypothetical protein
MDLVRAGGAAAGAAAGLVPAAVRAGAPAEAGEATDASAAIDAPEAIVAGLREARRARCAAEADELRWVARLASQCRSEALDRVGELSAGGGVHDAEVLGEALAVDAVSCALGVSRASATELVGLSERLTQVMPTALDAWSSGVLDDRRVRVLARATEVVDDATARRVVAEVLPVAGDAPWHAPSPRRWRSRVERAVVSADVEAAARRREAALAARRVRAWAEEDGIGVLQLRADAADIALADQVITDLARSWPDRDADGARLTMDQRRSDALMGLFRSVRDGSLAAWPGDEALASSIASGSGARDSSGAGADSRPDARPSAVARTAPVVPNVPVRREIDLGLVLHADTLFSEGPNAERTAELRGLGSASVVDPISARRLARRQLDHGTGVQVVLVDDTGAVQHVVRLSRREAKACRSRPALRAAVRAALEDAPALSTDSYVPTETIARHVRAEAPTCSFYDCPRKARSCDLDHDVPWPKGPTSVANLDPKCRRHHNAKTLALARTTLNAGPGNGSRRTTWSLPAGITVTTAPEPLPGAASSDP